MFLVAAAFAAIMSVPASGAGLPGPFEDGSPRKAFRLAPCQVIAVEDAASSRPVVKYQRRKAEPTAPVAQLSRGKAAHTVLMTVLDSNGNTLAGPTTVAEGCIMMLPVFTGDVNGDGRDDFIAMLQVPSLSGRPCCDVGVALSSGDGYRITALRRNVDPGARDFVDLGGGRCGFVHTDIVYSLPGRNASLSGGYTLVYRLFEFRGDRTVVSNAGGFPRAVRMVVSPDGVARGEPTDDASAYASEEALRKIICEKRTNSELAQASTD
jgi:hypothetical protein